MEGSTETIQTEGTTIFVRALGSGPPLLLLHGFPETHLMWRHIAPKLARNFTLVCADLRGYGKSGCPPSTDDHMPYSKRSLGKDMMSVMKQLGFERFSVAGHDRGGRVAYRMALDYPERIVRLVVLDVLPILTMWNLADARLALGFWPWSMLAQPEPLPERMLEAIPETIIDDALRKWGSSPLTFSPKIRQEYVDALRDPEHIRAICEEYRAAATIDREHDKSDMMKGYRIACPLLILWAAGGALDTWYAEQSGPLALWRKWANKVEGSALKGGHFFPEENPGETADKMLTFLRKSNP